MVVMNPFGYAKLNLYDTETEYKLADNLQKEKMKSNNFKLLSILLTVLLVTSNLAWFIKG